MLYRKISKTLDKYYKNDANQILIITGARQIGKSFIIRETAKSYFKNYIEINLKDDFDGNKLYENAHDIDSFYLQVSAEYGDKLGNNKDTIIFLDEIQVYPHLISLLKPLRKDNKYRYIASGSLLGITLRHTFIPIGSIQEVKMFPLDFEEFLIANNVGENVLNRLQECYKTLGPIPDGIHKKIMSLFRQYLISGGLPDSVNAFLEKNVSKIRKIQEETYKYYQDDAARYDNINSLKIRTIYNYLPSYMENKVKRVNFNKIENKRNANYISYQDEFDYLIFSGVTLPAKAIANPRFPLNESMSKNLIKLYYNDVGILSNLLYKNNITGILYEDSNANLGSIYETAVACELIAHGHELYYFDSKKVGEVDFLINDYELSSPVAIEIKSGKDAFNFRAIPKLIKEPYNLKKGYVFSNYNVLKEEKGLTYLPIYLIMFI